MADELQFDPLGGMTDGLDPFASANFYLKGADIDRQSPFDIRPFEIAKQAVSGYLSGFSTLPIGDISENRIEQFARQIGHLGGFIGFGFPGGAIRNAGRSFLLKQGMGSAAAAAANFRSLPMFAADLITRKGFATKAGQTAMKYLDDTGRLGTRQFLREATHLGTASAVSAWSEGVAGMAMAGLQGGILGGGTASIANLPVLRQRDTTGNVLRTIAGSIVDAAPTYFMGGDALDLTYAALLGGYFGYRQPSAQMARAQEFYFSLDESARGMRGRIENNNSGFFDLPKDVQEEVKRLTGLDKTQEVGAALGGIRDKLAEFTGIDVSKQKDPVYEREMREREQILDTLRLREKYDVGTAPGRAIVNFAEGVVRDPNTNLKDWDTFNVAELMESVGNQARMEGMTFDAFKTEASSLMEKATGYTPTSEQMDGLKTYYYAKAQEQYRPTFGLDDELGLVQFNQGRRNFDGQLTETESTVNLVNQIQRAKGLLGDLPDFAGHLTIVGYNQKQGKRKVSAQTNRIPTGDLLNTKKIFDRMKDPYFDVVGKDGTRHRVKLYDRLGNPRFYAVHGRADKNEVHFMLYNLEGKSAGSQLPAIWKAMGEGGEAAYKQMEAQAVNEMVKSGMDTASARREYQKQFVSNVNYWKDINGGMKLTDLMKDGFIDNVADFNKRLQPLFNNYYRPDASVIDRDVNYMVVEDFSKFAKIGRGKNVRAVGEQVTDGAVLVSDEVFDALSGMTARKSEGGSSLKPFILSDDGENGLMIGKMAFHRADNATQAAMKKAGVDLLMHSSAVKQRGGRQVHRYRVDGDQLMIGGQRGAFRAATQLDVMKMKASDIMLDIHSVDKVQGGQRLAKQIATMLASEQLEYRLAGNTVEHFADRVAADRRERAFYEQVVHKGLLGDDRVTALDDYLRDPTDERLETLFAGDSPIVEQVNKVQLFNAIFKPGNEKLYDRMNRYLADRVDNYRDDDGIARTDDADSDRDLALLQKTMDRRTPFDIIMETVEKQGKSSHAISLSHAARQQMSRLYSNWIVSAMTRPVWQNSAKLVMKPVTPGIARGILYDGERIRFGNDDKPTPITGKDIPNLTPDTFLLEGGLRQQKISATKSTGEGFVRARRTLEEVYKDFSTTSDPEYRDRLAEDLTGVLARVPIADISGVQDLRLGGFTNTKGKGVILHEKTMERLGGADLDIDTAFVYWNMPKGMKEIVRVNREAQDAYKKALKIGEKDGQPIFEDRIGIYLRRPEDMPGLSQGASDATKRLAMFDPYHRNRIAQEVSRGRSELTGQAVNNRTVIGQMYSHARRHGALIERLPGDELFLRYEPRDDNGILFRSRSDGAIQATVDVARYGAMARPEEMLAFQLHGAFKRIDVIDGKGKLVKELMSDASFERRGTELHFSADAKDLQTLLSNTGRLQAGKRTRFRLSDTMYQRLRDVNSVFFGADRSMGQPRPYNVDDIVQASRNYPTDSSGRPIGGYLHELSRIAATLEPQNMSNLDYVFNDFSRFESAWREVSDFVNRNNKRGLEGELPFFYDEKMHLAIPSKSFLSQLRTLRPYMRRGNDINIRTDHGRGLIAANKEIYNKIKNDILTVDKIAEGDTRGLGQYFPNEGQRGSTLKQRKRALTRINSEVNRFVDHDMDMVASIPMVRQMFIASGLKGDEARQLLEGATYLKAAFARRYAQDLSRAGRERSEQGANRREKSASANARDTFMREYNRLMSTGNANAKRDLPEIFRNGIDDYIRRLNKSEERTSGREAPVTFEGVKDLFDAFLISPHGSSTVRDAMQDGERTISVKPTAANSALNAMRTQSRTIGYEVASERVLGEYIRQYDNVFGAMNLKRTDNVNELLDGSIGRTEAEKRAAASRHIHKTVYPEGVEVSKEVQDAADNVARLAASIPAFREHPETVLEVMRHFYGKAQPEDFTLSELKGMENMLKRWKRGGGWLTRFLRDGWKGFGQDPATLKGGMEFKPYHTVQFIRTNSDFTKRDDLRLINKHKRGEGRELLTSKQLPDGTWETQVMSAATRVPESHFDRLIDVNGVQRDTLTNGKYNIIQAEVNKRLAPILKGRILRHDTKIDDQDELFRIAIHEREIQGAKRQKSQYDYERFDDYQKLYQKRKDRAVRELAKKYNLDVTGKDRGAVEKMLSDRNYTVQLDGRQQTLPMRQVVNELVKRMDFLDDIFDVHIAGQPWIDKYLRPFVQSNGEIHMGRWGESLENMFQRGLPDSEDQHIPHDVGRLFAYENEILVEAKRLIQSGEPAPRDPDAVQALAAYGNDRDVQFALRSVDWNRPVIDDLDARALSRLLRTEAGKNKNLTDADRERLRDVADYLHKPLHDRDMRIRWQGREDYSQFENDLFIAQNPSDANRLTYFRRKLRDQTGILATEKLEGAWPHMGHDSKALTADGAERIKAMKDDTEASMLREEINAMLSRQDDDMFEASDAYADYMLDDNSGAFLSRFREETFSSAMRRGRNWDGYRTDAQVLNAYARQLGGSGYNNIAHTLSRNVIRSFEASGAMGEHNASWGTWMRVYVRDTMGKPTTFTPEVFERLKLKNTPYYWLSDHAFITKRTGLNKALLRLSGVHKATDADRAIFERNNGRAMTLEEEKEFEQRQLTELTKVQPGDNLHPDQVKVLGRMFKGFSDMEAKYEMMALMFHAKSYAANVIGGTINTVAHTGWKPFRKASDLTYWQGLNPEFSSLKDVENWVAKMGVIEDYIIHEAAITGRFREGKWKQFFDDAFERIKENKSLADRELYEIAKKHGVTEKSVDTAAYFMRESERKLRTRSFLAGYIKARDSMSPMSNLPFDHPILLDQARKTVAASQFLYGAAERPAFARTNFGKVFSRFKLWGWSSPKMRRIIYEEAGNAGYAPGSENFKKLQNIVFADLMATSLAAMFPFSIFEYTLPPPISWFADLADYFFGEGYEKDSAFFGSPLGPINEITPVLLSKFVNVGDEAFRAIVSDEVDTMSTYQLAVLFPFGRMAYDVARTLGNPSEAPRYLAGVPLREFAGLRDQVVRNRTIRETAPVLQEALTSRPMTEKEVVAFFESQGREATQARTALRSGLERGYVTRSMERTATGRAYMYSFDPDGLSAIDRFTEYGAPSFVRGF